ncbi:MAG: 50S ribosomal protein L4 [Bacteroidia bacterium]
MEASVFDIQGKDTGRTVDLADQVFAIETPSDNAIYQDVRLILANRRQGTHKSKERGEIRGSKKKMYRQKGTGNARAGHKRSPLRRGGGTIFGPRPRNYGFKLNRKLRVLARRSALTYKAREEAGIKVVENISFDAPKTKQFIGMLNDLSLANNKVLLVLGESKQAIYLSGRNLKNANVMEASTLSTYDILNADTLLIEEGAVSIINDQLAN